MRTLGRISRSVNVRIGFRQVGLHNKYTTNAKFSSTSEKKDDAKGSMENIPLYSPLIDKVSLAKISKSSLKELETKIGSKSIESPYSVLNTISQKDIEIIMSRFTQKLDHTLSNTTQDIDLINSLKLVDFINPNMSRFPYILQLISYGKLPVKFPELYNLSNTSDLATFLLTRLFYKEYVLYKVETVESTDEILDFSNPAEWYPEARKMKRKIIMHVGPTNSGKTYNSLKQLSKSKTGYYAGPLRLLAREIYEKFNNEGVHCNLITGEEVIPSMDEFGKISGISSGTIEMIPLNKKMDLCIIDEIQMISDPQRGNAWTNAVLGVQAKEIHLCGEESAVPLIQKMCDITGDEVEIKKFERLGKLTVEKTHLKSVKELRKGDCLISFSKKSIIELKCKIEQETKLKVAVVYGALPPEIRSVQANGFNNGDFDVLVASDAVGMGLNLHIKRIVFETILKFDGQSRKKLTPSQVKQIGGRAGRFTLEKGKSEGFITTMNKGDLNHVNSMMKTGIINLEKAIIWPTDTVWKAYMAKFEKGTSFFKILTRFAIDIQDANLSFYEVNDIETRAATLQLFTKNNLYQRATIDDQLVLSLAPINLKMSDNISDTAYKLFENIVDCSSKSLFDFDFINPRHFTSKVKLRATFDETVEILQDLERMHKIILLFLWLSQRWPTLFIDKESAYDMKSLIEKRISEELQNLKSSKGGKRSGGNKWSKTANTKKYPPKQRVERFLG